MPENLPNLPAPDAVRGAAVKPPEPRVNIWNDPLNPDPVPEPKKASTAEDKNLAAQPSGLSDFDAPHAFASVLGSGFGRVAGVILISMVAYGVTEACYRVSQIFEGWHTGGIKGFFGAIFAVPGAIFAAPGHWMTALGDGLLSPTGVPYLLLIVGGIILAVRSEIHVLRLLLFYVALTAVHGSVYLKMTNVLSLALLCGFLYGSYRLYRWLWAQQFPVEEELAPAEE